MKHARRLFNVRGVESGERLYIAAYSKADAVRILVELYSDTPSHWKRELENYGSPCWGTVMECILPSRGVWRTSWEDQQPERIYPKKTVVAKS